MGCCHRRLSAANSRTNLRQCFLAAAKLAPPNRRTLGPSRKRVSAIHRAGNSCALRNRVCERLDLELVFAVAETASRYSQDLSDRSDETGEGSEVPATNREFQRSRGAP